MASPSLSAAQAHALFDILTHHDTYAEIQQFRSPDAIKSYGPPFTPQSTVSTSPLLQTMFTSFALKLPGLRDLPDSFWQDRAATLIERLGAAELSESYDKGSIGARKTLATAASAMLEHPARGFFGGVKRKEIPRDREWDKSKPEDVLLAWDCFVQDVIYGTRVDEMFENAAKTDKLEDHPPLVQTAHRYILVNLASLLHHTLVLSPDGPYLQKVMTNMHRLIPYGMSRQALRMGNAASMINAMMKLMLTKMSVSSLTNWVGITQGRDEGMNLTQTIISTLLGWDIADFQKRAVKIEKDKEPPKKEHLDCIKAYIKQDRKVHEDTRSRSEQEGRSMVSIILEDGKTSPLNESQHKMAAEYLAIQLSIRDREELTKILCKSNPDILTQLIRDVVGAYEPIIRKMHESVDLSGGMTDMENFMNDFVKMSKPKKSKKGEEPTPPTVEDYLELLQKHIPASHRFMHQFCKNGGELAQWYKDYMKSIAKQFRQEEYAKPEGSLDKEGSIKVDVRTLSEDSAGDMTPALNRLMSDLSSGDRNRVLEGLDSHAKYLSDLQTFSNARMKSTLALKTPTTFGPGTYLQRWQDLMDAALFTPATPKGPVRTGKSESVKDQAMVDVDGDKLGDRFEAKETRELPQAPDVSEVVKICGPPFRKILQKRSADPEENPD